MAGIQIPKHPDAIFRCACQWVMVVRLDRTRSVKCASSLLSLLGCLGCTERSVMLARTTSPRSVNNVEVRSIPRGTTASEGYGVSVVRVTCS